MEPETQIILTLIEQMLGHLNTMYLKCKEVNSKKSVVRTTDFSFLFLQCLNWLESERNFSLKAAIKRQQLARNMKKIGEKSKKN